MPCEYSSQQVMAKDITLGDVCRIWDGGFVCVTATHRSMGLYLDSVCLEFDDGTTLTSLALEQVTVYQPDPNQWQTVPCVRKTAWDRILADDESV